MSHFILSISPIFLMIVLGHLLRRGGIPNTEFWNLNDKLAYWVLMPALLFSETSTIEIGAGVVGSFATAIIGGFLAAACFGLLVAKLCGLANPVTSSVLQGAARHNTFIALAVAERVLGQDALSMAALVTAILIPITNLSIVPALVVLQRGNGSEGIVKNVLRDLGRNPLLICVALGMAVNLSGVGEIPVLHDTTRILGAAALPIMLMCVGANIRLRAMQSSVLPVAISIAAKMMVFPAAVIGLAYALQLSETELYVLLLFAAAPTASSAYTLARQLGGDAPLMAAIVTIQTALSFVTLPLTLLAATALWRGL